MKKSIIICMLFASFCMTISSCKNSDSKKSENEGCDSIMQDSICASSQKCTSRQVDGNLVIYTPEYSRIDLVCGTMPSMRNKEVIYCAEAAFTGELLEKFVHSNIAGNHVSGGTLYKGYTCRRNTGAFVYYDGKYKFLYTNYTNELEKAAENGGMGFGQEMMIHNGSKVKTRRSSTNTNMFRALCELDGRLCVIDTKEYEKFGDFTDALIKKGVTEAIYLDMGPGWNYSWYRDINGTAHEIHKERTIYTTNWITFYK